MNNLLLARIFHRRRSRRREEADGSISETGPPPHVGGYRLRAFPDRCEISGLARRTIRPLLGLVCACAGLVAAWSAPAPTNSTLKVGEVFPDLAKFELAGEWPASLKGRIVVVDFWASWCGPCQKTFPLMEELHHRYGKRGLVILAINEDKSRAAMEEFLKDHPVTFAVVRDAKRKLAAEINVPALPTSYLLDGTGRVHSIQPGARTAKNSKEFIKEIEALLEQNSPKP